MFMWGLMSPIKENGRGSKNLGLQAEYAMKRGWGKVKQGSFIQFREKFFFFFREEAGGVEGIKAKD